MESKLNVQPNITAGPFLTGRVSVITPVSSYVMLLVSYFSFNLTVRVETKRTAPARKNRVLVRPVTSVPPRLRVRAD